MREKLEQRLQELRTEFKKGEQTLKELEEQVSATRNTLLRISGAIQVLEEELGDEGESRQGEAVLTGEPDENSVPGVERTVGEKTT